MMPQKYQTLETKKKQKLMNRNNHKIACYMGVLNREYV